MTEKLTGPAKKTTKLKVDLLRKTQAEQESIAIKLVVSLPELQNLRIFQFFKYCNFQTLIIEKFKGS